MPAGADDSTTLSCDNKALKCLVTVTPAASHYRCIVRVTSVFLAAAGDYTRFYFKALNDQEYKI